MKKILSWAVALFLLMGIFPLSACKKTTDRGSRYEITAEYRDEAKTLAGTVKVEFLNEYEKEISLLKFDLYPNAYRKNALYKPISENYFTSAYYAGESYGDITITSVAGVKNWSIDGEDENILIVHLLRPLASNAKVTLDISFVTSLAKVNHATGVTPRSVNLGHVFPSLCVYRDGEFVEHAYTAFGNPFISECADYKVNLTAPSNYVVVASAPSVITKGLESKTKYAFSLDDARDFALTLSKEYEVLKTERNGVKLEYAYYDDKDAKSRLDFVATLLAYYEKQFGKYPYPSFSLSQTGLIYAETAYPGLVMLSDSLGEEESMRSIARGVARQWWYGAVGHDPVQESWQGESLAEYSAITFFEEYPEFGLKKEDLVKNALREYRSYFSVYGSIFGGVDTRMSRPLSEFSSEYEYCRLAVDKGVILWDTLRKSIGDKKFFQGLKNYYKAEKYRIATPNDLITAFEKTGVSVEGFFDSFLSGKGVI